MKGLTIVGVLLLVLGALSFVVPIPHSEDHSLKVGDAKIGVQTHSSDKVPPPVSVVLLGAGLLVLALGARNA
jgi:hypothetical protein